MANTNWVQFSSERLDARQTVCMEYCTAKTCQGRQIHPMASLSHFSVSLSLSFLSLPILLSLFTSSFHHVFSVSLPPSPSLSLSLSFLSLLILLSVFSSSFHHVFSVSPSLSLSLSLSLSPFSLFQSFSHFSLPPFTMLSSSLLFLHPQLLYSSLSNTFYIHTTHIHVHVVYCSISTHFTGNDFV